MRKFLIFTLLLTLFSCAFEEPYFMTIEASSDSERITIDDHFVISEIPVAIFLKTKDLDSVQRSKFFVKLKVEEGTNMGLISDIKNELRKANVLNIRYYMVKSKPKVYGW